jgi:hypothetical protein
MASRKRPSNTKDAYLDTSNAVNQGLTVENAFLDIENIRRKRFKNDLPKGSVTLPGANNPEVFGANYGEILVKKNFNQRKLKKGTLKKGEHLKDPKAYVAPITDGAPLVFSSTNGLAVRVDTAVNTDSNGVIIDPKSLTEAQKDEIEEDYQFAGLTFTTKDFDGEGKRLNRYGMVTQIGGIITTKNTSTATIHPGMLIIWRFPYGCNRAYIEGTHNDKEIIVSEPFNAGEYLRKKFDIDNPTEAKLSLEEFHDLTNFYRSKIVGVALTGALPGEQFDIKLGRPF